MIRSSFRTAIFLMALLSSAIFVVAQNQNCPRGNYPAGKQGPVACPRTGQGPRACARGNRGRTSGPSAGQGSRAGMRGCSMTRVTSAGK